MQDLGRPGHAHLGVPRSGALDAPAAALVNRLVGNPPDAAVLETTLDGCALRPRSHGHRRGRRAPPARSRWTAARSPGARRYGCPPGRCWTSGRRVRGVRGYVAVSGGVAVEPVLGSRSTDLLSGLGPPPLDGRRGAAPGAHRTGAHARVDVAPQPAPPAELVLRVTPGPARRLVHRRRRCAPSPRAPTAVSSASNRIGLRTEGPPWSGPSAGELPSEGMVLGAVQVPPDGRPVVFLADHPTTGGYPVIAVVRAADLPAAAQAAPGTPVRFVAVHAGRVRHSPRAAAGAARHTVRA